MSSVEPISGGTESAVTREVNDHAVDIRKILLSLRLYSRKKPHVVKLSAGGELNLYLMRLLSLKRRWKIKLHAQLTTCAECRKRVAHIERVFLGLPEVPELAGWLEDIIHTHAAFHTSALSRPPAEEPPPAPPIKISMPDDKSGARIRVRSAKEEDGVDIARAASPPRARIKIHEPAVARPGRALERSSAAGGKRSVEAARVVPAIEYQVGIGTTVEVVIPGNVCTALVHHCRASLEHGKEVGGVIIGFKEEERARGGSSETYRIRATDLIHFRVADSSGSRLYLTPDSWAHVSDVESDRGYEAQGKVRLGWYHTHPNQGIFFSAFDHDFHTVFSKPFQVALVVDPRNMEAGLFYWDNYARRSLLGPTTFFLTQTREPGPTVAVLPDAERAAVRRGRLAPRRLLFFAALTLVVGMLLSGGTLDFLTPIDIILLAVTGSLGLGLWNAQWFHPTHPSELIILTRVEQWINAAKTPADKRAPADSTRRRPVTVVLAASALILLLVAAIVWRSQKTKVLKEPPEVSRQQESGSPAAHPAARVDNETREIIFRSDSANEITLESSDGALVINYQLAGSSWTCDEQEEQAFFQQLFRWDLTEGVSQPYIKDIQIKWASGNNQHSDGKWGQNTRGILLGKLRTVAKTNGSLELLLPGNKPLTVSVVERHEDYVSAAPASRTSTKKSATPSAMTAKRTATPKPTAPPKPTATPTPAPTPKPTATPKPARGASQPENKPTSRSPR